MLIVLRYIQKKFLCMLAFSLCIGHPNLTKAEATLNIFAAASLKGPLDKAAAVYSESQNVSVTVSFASSAAAARQITHGAPADVYISANAMWAEYLLQRRALIDSTRRDLFSNRLTLITNSADLTFQGWTKFAEHLEDNRIAIGQTQTVPAGIYAYQALNALGIWPEIKNNVLETENVRAALAYVRTKAVPFGIVYESDLMEQTGVYKVATFPQNTHDPIRYVGAVVSTGQINAAKDFLDYLATAPARDIFTSYGFSQLVE